ncbi:CocE/NonD family hydrolase [Hoyosella rhizosphaerae]|uniref:Peptidase S15 n=1 Tax=Hoyosella rhizosphaerae TaxID=1755582 RepID=A0A916X8T3_9ACTN|nr:CocE/NonD family hydrolase [Hoyosella rhizosphaerae]MBN4926935.1 CocE/NonD family hydrolase [Hoyosella rhizosphaerae]GGC55361.1 peptidase S15 [Hoyosella rhizosphaerae]
MEHIAKFPYAIESTENVFIPMRDGARLAARMWMPTDALKNPIPAVIEYIPYRKRDVTRGRDSLNHPYIAGHGYACVRIDLRGSGDSDGVLEDEYLEVEHTDAVDAISWIASQPWCDGNVGMMGISWGGFNSLQVAAKQPPELKAIISASATEDLYVDNMHYMGGCLLSDNLSEATVMFAFNSLPPDPLIVGDRWREMWSERLRDSGLWIEKWLRHQHRDDYWRRVAINENYASIQCPVFAVGGWADGYTNAIFRLLEHLQVPCHALIGPWGHKYPHTGVPGPAIGFLDEVVRWWDHWLKGRDTGLLDEPSLRVWMQDSVPPKSSYEDRPGRWVAEEHWPSQRIEEKHLRLRIGSPAGLNETSLAAEDGENGSVHVVRSPLSVGMFAGKWASYAAPPDLPSDQREEDGGALVYDTNPLTEDVEILGLPRLQLAVSSDKPVAMVAARLSDVAPSGEATRVTYGLLNLTHRNGSANPQPLEVGKTYQVEVQLNGVAQTFPAGHKIRVALSTSYWPLAWPSPEAATLSIEPEASVLIIPMRPPSAADESLRPFGPPSAAAELSTTRLSAPEHHWKVTRDLASGNSTLEIANDQGAFRIDETDTVLRRSTTEWFSFKNNDVESVRGETRTVRRISRGSWQIEVMTRTVMTSTARNFHITAELDAWECDSTRGDRRVYSENWEHQIPRNLV